MLVTTYHSDGLGGLGDSDSLGSAGARGLGISSLSGNLARASGSDRVDGLVLGGGRGGRDGAETLGSRGNLDGSRGRLGSVDSLGLS